MPCLWQRNALTITPAEGAPVAWPSTRPIDNGFKLGDPATLSVDVSKLTIDTRTAYVARNSNWDYQTFGHWVAKETAPAQGSYGVFSVGAATAGDKIPPGGGYANYTGEVIGQSGNLLLIATMTIKVDFNQKTASFTTTNTRSFDTTVTPAPNWVNASTSI